MTAWLAFVLGVSAGGFLTAWIMVLITLIRTTRKGVR